MNVSAWRVRGQNSGLHVIIGFLGDCSIDGYLKSSAVFWMNALQPLFPARHALFWIEAVYATPLLRYMHRVPAGGVPRPTSDMSEPLRLRKVTLVAAQRLFRMPALRDIDHGADHLNKFSIATQNWMADAMNVSDCSIGFHDSELDIAIYFLEERPITCHPELVKIFWVYS